MSAKTSIPNYGITFAHQRAWYKNLAHACIPDMFYIAYRHKKMIGYWPNPFQPKTLNDWAMRSVFIEKIDYTNLIDKASARDYVAKILGPQYSPERYALTENPKLDWSSLPDKFVISNTNGSGMIMIINDKKTLNTDEAERVLAQWLKVDYARFAHEPIYKKIKPRLLVEENLSDENGDAPNDYKFFCFHGEPRLIHVNVLRNFERHRIFYNPDWSLSDINYADSLYASPLERPSMLEEMLDITRKLAKDFPFVRVDLYQVGNRIIFGELTFFPAGGRLHLKPNDALARMGSWWAEGLKNKES